MCRIKSGIIFENNIILCDETESHDVLLNKLGLSDNVLNPNFVKAELMPPNKEWWNLDWHTHPENWIFKVFQDNLPSWFTDNTEKYELLFRETVERWWKLQVHVGIETDYLELKGHEHYFRDCKIKKLVVDGMVKTDNCEIDKIIVHTTELKPGAFADCTGIRRVVLPDNMTIIPENAFCCSSIEEVVLPADLKVIGDYAFSDCAFLTDINIPASLEIVKSSAFLNCSGSENIRIINSLFQF